MEFSLVLVADTTHKISAYKATQTIRDTLHTMNTTKKSKAIPVAGRGGLWGCEMSRTPHCPDSQLTYGS
jgi:hypothetical protein